MNQHVRKRLRFSSLVVYYCTKGEKSSTETGNACWCLSVVRASVEVDIRREDVCFDRKGCVQTEDLPF